VNVEGLRNAKKEDKDQKPGPVSPKCREGWESEGKIRGKKLDIVNTRGGKKGSNLVPASFCAGGGGGGPVKSGRTTKKSGIDTEQRRTTGGDRVIGSTNDERGGVENA